MHLSPYQTAIKVAYQALLHDIALCSTRPEYAFNFIWRRPAHVLPRERPHPTIPIPVKEYDPMESVTPFAAKEKMVQLAAFQSTFHGSITPFSSDMVPLILDTGASVSISPCRTDFISPIRPAQHITIKGIASGLNVAGIGNMAYTFINDAGDTQTITLKNSLYVPQSAVHLICPRQIGASTGHHADGLYATATRSHLIVEGQLTTLAYDHLSQLPVLFTKPGITTYLNFVETLHVNSPASTSPMPYLEKLFNTTARWLYIDPYSPEPHLFESFWSGADPPPTTRKRKFTHLDSSPLRGSPECTLLGSLPQNPLCSQPAPDPLRRSHSASVTLDVDPALNISLPPPDGNDDQQGFQRAHADSIGINVASSGAPHLCRPQYDYVDNTTEFQSFKRARGIHGAILVLVASTPAMSRPRPAPNRLDVFDLEADPPDSSNIFSLNHTLPNEHSAIPLHAYPIMDNKADTLTQSQMLKTSDATHFVDSQIKEIQGLVQMGVFDLQNISTLPAHAKLLSSIWSYRRKRSPAGDILKYKSRICVDESQQRLGRDFWEVYAPVVSWPTIRLMLLLSSLLDLRQRQVDYTQAFPQAPLEDPVYIRVPQG